MKGKRRADSIVFRGVGLILAAMFAAMLGGSAAAKPGNSDKGREIYDKRCVWCHGEDGDGAGPAGDRLVPPPRDFTLGQYKFKTTDFDEIAPADDDLYRMIRNGMSGTAMPGWSDVLSEQEIWDVIAYIKTFAEFDGEQPPKPIDYGTQVPSSPESIAKGKILFEDRCAECHGDSGKGVAIKKLKDDAGARTWPRNLTKPWTFRASNDPKDVFARISAGIPTTQMPSFADPVSKKKMTVEERWHVANYVASLGKTGLPAKPENTVVKGDKVDGALPDTPEDSRWQRSVPTTFLLVPQIIARERFFTPANDTITVRAQYNDKEIAFLLEWDDRTKSIPGDAEAEKIADSEMGPDAVAVQLPSETIEGMEKPYFGMGDAARQVNIWEWRAGSVGDQETVRLLDGRGVGKLVARDAAASGLRGKGVWRDGGWRVVLSRPLATSAPDKDIQFREGVFVPVAFAAWDGSNGERGGKHTTTTWYWLLLVPPTGNRPLMLALIAAAVIVAGEAMWARSGARRRSADKPAKEGA